MVFFYMSGVTDLVFYLAGVYDLLPFSKVDAKRSHKTDGPVTFKIRDLQHAKQHIESILRFAS
jgi:hypothetical protein